MAKDWISSAIKHPGALTAEAAAKGVSMDKLCSADNMDTTTARRCALRHTLKGFSKK